MKRFLATTAVALLAFGPVAAETAGNVFLPTVEHGVRASNFIGKNVYVSEGEIANQPVAAADATWTKVGDINDIIMGPQGGVDVVLVDVGGFLGIGAKTVAVSLDQIHMIADSDSRDNYFLVFNGSKALLEEAPEFKEAAVVPAEPAVAPATTLATTNDAATATTMTDASAAPVAFSALTAEQLTGQTVTTADGSNVGRISDLVLDGDNKISAAIVDVGGFLGMGAKPVALTPDMLVITRSDSDSLSVHVNQTKEQLEAMPEFAKP